MSAKKLGKRAFNLGTFVVGDYRLQRSADGSRHTSQRVGKKAGNVTVEINFDALWRYAERALASKNGKSTMADGAIVFKVAPGSVKRTREEEPVA